MMKNIAIRVPILACVVLCVRMNANCHGQRLSESLRPVASPPAILIGAWKAIQVHPSFGSPRDCWLMIGRATHVTTDWQLPLKEGRVSAVSKGTMYAELIGWNEDQQLSSLACQFNPIRIGSGRYANILVEVSGSFSHSYLIKYECTKDQKLKIWFHMDGPALEQLLQSGQVQRDSPTGIAVDGVQELINESPGKDPLATLFPETPTFTFRPITRNVAVPREREVRPKSRAQRESDEARD